MYSVFNPRGEKIADCGSLRDATDLIQMRNYRWGGHYYKCCPLSGDIIDVTKNQLPPNQKYIGWENIPEEEFDTEFNVVAGQEIPIQKKLPNSQQKPLNL